MLPYAVFVCLFAASSCLHPALYMPRSRFAHALQPATRRFMLLQIEQELDVNKLIAIAEKAGKAIMAVYEGDDWDVDHKADDSPLTRADREANQIICDALMEWTPHIPIISEENKLVPYSIRKVWSTCSVRPHSLMVPRMITVTENEACECRCPMLARVVSRQRAHITWLGPGA